MACSYMNLQLDEPWKRCSVMDAFNSFKNIVYSTNYGSYIIEVG